MGDFFSANNAFESIWNAYPRKEAKELARAVWHRLWRQGAIRIEALMESLRRFCRSDGWNREHGRYVPQLVNWLRGQRWLDELPSSPAAVATDHDAKVRAWEAAQERRQADPDLEAVRPQFEAFLARFRDTRLRGPAWGLWTLLHKAGRAPQAHDVADASASPLDFLRHTGFGGVDIFILLSAMGLAISLERREQEYTAFMGRRAGRAPQAMSAASRGRTAQL